MSALLLRPVADTSRRARLYQLSQGPWPEVRHDETHPGDTVALLRAGGVTGYLGQVNLARWTLPDTPQTALPGHAAFQAPWPGQRAVVPVAAHRGPAGHWHDTPSDAVLLLAAVWARTNGEICASLVVQGDQAVPVEPARLWHWLHWAEGDALAALG